MELRGLGFVGFLVGGTLFVVIVPLLLSIILLRFFIGTQRLALIILHLITMVILVGVIVYFYVDPLASLYVAAIPPAIALAQLLLAAWARKESRRCLTS